MFFALFFFWRGKEREGIPPLPRQFFWGSAGHIICRDPIVFRGSDIDWAVTHEFRVVFWCTLTARVAPLCFVLLFVFIFFFIVCVLMTTAIVFIVELVRHCWRHFCKIYYSLRSLLYEFMLVDDRTHFVSWIPFVNKIVFKPRVASLGLHFGTLHHQTDSRTPDRHLKTYPPFPSYRAISREEDKWTDRQADRQKDG